MHELKNTKGFDSFLGVLRVTPRDYFAALTSFETRLSKPPVSYAVTTK